MRFHIRAASGGYRAVLIAANNEIVWWTEVYSTKAGANHAVKLAKAAFAAPVYDVS